MHLNWVLVASKMLALQRFRYYWH